MSEKLKPCPFCGGEAKIGMEWPTGCGDYSPIVFCADCGAKTQVKDWGSETEAIKAWDRRINNEQETNDE